MQIFFLPTKTPLKILARLPRTNCLPVSSLIPAAADAKFTPVRSWLRLALAYGGMKSSNPRRLAAYMQRSTKYYDSEKIWTKKTSNWYRQIKRKGFIVTITGYLWYRSWIGTQPHEDWGTELATFGAWANLGQNEKKNFLLFSQLFLILSFSNFQDVTVNFVFM